MLTYNYLTRLTPDIEKAIMKEKSKNGNFNLNWLINSLLNDHFDIKDTKK